MVLYFQILTAGVNGEPVDAAKTFAEQDPYGFIMAMLGMGIVFSILILTYIIFSNTPKLFSPAYRQKMKDFFRKKTQIEDAEAVAETEAVAEADLTGEINAAIAAAIHLYRSELHDFEDTVITMKKVSKTYSPWSSKIYGLRNLNQP